MSGKVLAESMRAQEALIKHQGLERSLQTLKLELSGTQDAIERTKANALRRRRALRCVSLFDSLCSLLSSPLLSCLILSSPFSSLHSLSSSLLSTGWPIAAKTC